MTTLCPVDGSSFLVTRDRQQFCSVRCRKGDSLPAWWERSVVSA